jgi:hypothetical protein
MILSSTSSTSRPRPPPWQPVEAASSRAAVSSRCWRAIGNPSASFSSSFRISTPRSGSTSRPSIRKRSSCVRARRVSTWSRLRDSPQRDPAEDVPTPADAQAFSDGQVASAVGGTRRLTLRDPDARAMGTSAEEPLIGQFQREFAERAARTYTAAAAHYLLPRLGSGTVGDSPRWRDSRSPRCRVRVRRVLRRRHAGSCRRDVEARPPRWDACDHHLGPGWCEPASSVFWRSMPSATSSVSGCASASSASSVRAASRLCGTMSCSRVPCAVSHVRIASTAPAAARL